MATHATPIDRDDVPEWLHRRIAIICPTPEIITDGLAAIGWASTGDVYQLAPWIDRWGSTTTADGRLAFVSELIASPDDILRARQFAELVGAVLSIEGATWRYDPPIAIRFSFSESERIRSQ